MSSNESNPSNGKVAITIALITLLGTLITVVINNWDKIFHTSQDITVYKPGEAESDKTKSEESGNNPKNPVPDYESIAKAESIQWWNDRNSNNIDGLVYSSAIPFNADKKEIINSFADLRSYYTKTVGDGQMPALAGVEITKASALKQKGLLGAHADTLFGKLQLEDDPYIGVLSWQREGGSLEYVMIFFKKTNNTLKIAGVED